MSTDWIHRFKEWNLLVSNRRLSTDGPKQYTTRHTTIQVITVIEKLESKRKELLS